MPANMSEPASHRYLTVQEAAEELRVSTATIYRLIEARKIPVLRVGSQWRINLGEVLRADAESRPAPSWLSDRW